MKGTAEKKRSESLASLAAARRELLDAARLLSPEQQATAFLGEWSAMELLAHLIGWDHTNREAAEELLKGRLPGFYARFDRDWHSYNASLIATYRQDDFAALVAAAEASGVELQRFLAEIPAEKFAADLGVRSPRGRRVTIEMLVQAEAGDEAKHAAQLKAFLHLTAS